MPTQEVVEIKNGKKVHGRTEALSRVRAGRDGHEPGDGARRQRHSGRDQVRRPRLSVSRSRCAPDEVNRLLGIADEREEEEPKEEIPFLVGQAVAITEGPFTDFNGTVEEVMAGQGKGASVGVAVRTADVGGVGLFAVEGVLSGRGGQGGWASATATPSSIEPVQSPR